MQKPSLYTGFLRWRAAERHFDDWQPAGTRLADSGAVQLDTTTALLGHDAYHAGGYHGRNFYNGGAFYLGEASSPPIMVDAGATSALISWNADTPAGSWVELQIRAQFGSRWSKWYSMGVWASESSTIARHSVDQQGDEDGGVAVDTLKLKASAHNFQIKLRLFSADGQITPTLRDVAVVFAPLPSSPPLPAAEGIAWGQRLPIPACSQMVYPDGGSVWCSPTSVSMVLGYWRGDTGACAPRVHAAVDGVFDWLYDGHGNWPFNVAYAAAQGLEGYLARLTSLSQAEEWIAAGVPVIMSYAWQVGTLTGAPVPSSNGHLVVLVGFDQHGNPVINDPAGATDDVVQRTYLRAEVESLWQKHSGGVVYLIYPPGHAVPAL